MSHIQPEAIALSPPTAERVSQQGLQIAELVTWKLSDFPFRSQLMIGARSRPDYYKAVAIAQCAVMEVLQYETSHEWDTHTLQISIPPYWGEHPSEKINKRIRKDARQRVQLLGEQKSILLRGMSDLMSNRIIKLSVGELEIDPLAHDFDPMTGEAVIEDR